MILWRLSLFQFIVLALGIKAGTLKHKNPYIYMYTKKMFLTNETEFVLFLAVLENSVFPIAGLRQLTRAIKSGVRILNFKSDVTYSLPRKTPNDTRRRWLCDIKCHNERNDKRFQKILML